MLLQLWTKKKEEPNMGEALRRPGVGEGVGVRAATATPSNCPHLPAPSAQDHLEPRGCFSENFRKLFS